VTSQLPQSGATVLRLTGRVPADAVWFARDRGAVVYGRYADALAEQAAIRSSGRNLWSEPDPNAPVLLSGALTHAACVVQTLIDTSVAIFQALSPSHPRQIEPAVLDQCMAWVRLADSLAPLIHQPPRPEGPEAEAAASEARRSVPVFLPEWLSADPCPERHLLTVIGVILQLKHWTAGIMSDFRQKRIPDGYEESAGTIEALYERASEAAHDALSAWGILGDPGFIGRRDFVDFVLEHRPDTYDPEVVLDRGRFAIETFLALSQWTCLPRLVGYPVRDDLPVPIGLLDPWDILASAEAQRILFRHDMDIMGSMHELATAFADKANAANVRATLAFVYAQREQARTGAITEVGTFARSPYSPVYRAGVSSQLRICGLAVDLNDGAGVCLAVSRQDLEPRLVVGQFDPAEWQPPAE
jgi:hypothetical protein